MSSLPKYKISEAFLDVPIFLPSKKLCDFEKIFEKL